MTPTESRPETWTTRRLIGWTERFFGAKGLDHPRLSAEMLLAHVLETTRIKLYTDPDRPASELERAAFRKLVERAVDHEPVDYLIGHTHFFSMMFKVNRSVLIPRPSTETLVEHVVQHARHTPGFASPLIADIGTGSGAIALCVAKHIPNCHVIATDLHSEALEVATENARAQHVLDRIEFRAGDLLEPLRSSPPVRYLLSNPPYISDEEWDQVAPNVKDHEPSHALRGGSDGLHFIRPLIQQASTFLDHPGQLVIEIAASQSDAVLELASAAVGLENPSILSDHESLPRVLVANVK